MSRLTLSLTPHYRLLVKGKRPPAGAVAWVCRGMQCLPPIAEYAGIDAALAAT